MGVPGTHSNCISIANPIPVAAHLWGGEDGGSIIFPTFDEIIVLQPCNHNTSW